MGEKRIPVCHACGVEMKLKKHAILQVSDAENILPSLMMDYEPLYVDVYICPQCRRIELFNAISPLEEFENAPKDGIERFEYNFRDYTEKQLQKVIEGKGYVDEAKKAAKRLLVKRKGYEF